MNQINEKRNRSDGMSSTLALPNIELSIQTALHKWNSAVSEKATSSEEGRNLKTSIEPSNDIEQKDPIDIIKLKATVEHTNNKVETRTRKDSLLSAEGYRRRLQTFRTETYFAKPYLISPMICARFGWKNISQDILRCAHPKCRAILSVTIHPKLGPKSVKELTMQYRRMLATSHTKLCPFRADAERWLLSSLSEGTKTVENKSHTKSCVPPYLQSVCEDLSIFEENILMKSKNDMTLDPTLFSLTSIIIQQRMSDLHKVLSIIQNHFHNYEYNAFEYQVEFPSDLSEYLKLNQNQKLNLWAKNELQTKPKATSIQFVTLLTESFISRQQEQQLILDSRVYDDDPGKADNQNLLTCSINKSSMERMNQIFKMIQTRYPPSSKTSSIKENKLSPSTFLLALFGWSPVGVVCKPNRMRKRSRTGKTKDETKSLNMIQENSSVPKVIVRCQICLAKATINLSDQNVETIEMKSRKKDSLPKHDDVNKGCKRPPSQQQGKNNDGDITPIHPITSHRFYCPYSSSFVSQYSTDLSSGNSNQPMQTGKTDKTNTDGTTITRDGWKIIVDKLIDCHFNSKQTNKNFKTSKNRILPQVREHENIGQSVLSIVQNILHS